jgi:intracellular multiplication protein IcmE
MSDFNDDDFDNFDDNNFEDFNSSNSLKDVWQNSPLIKLFVIIGGIALAVVAFMMFTGNGDDQKSRISNAPDNREILGGEISQNYADVLEEVNEQRLDTAVQTGTSTIPMLINPEEQELLTSVEETPPYEEFDPLATFRSAVQDQDPKAEKVIAEEPVLLSPQDLRPVQQPVTMPSPEAIQALAQAMATDVNDILKNHNPAMPKIQQVTSKTYFQDLAAAKTAQNGTMVDTDGDGIPDTPLNNSYSNDGDFVSSGDDNGIVETILIPAGDINYAQLLTEANSDVPGPVLAQLVSGSLAGARLLGQFLLKDEYLVLSFNSIIIDGINQPIAAVAIDPSTTLPGVASDVDHKYWQRVFLPAAAKFLEGIGSAIAQDSETTVTVSGDTVIEEKKSLDFKQEVGRGVEEGFSEIADFMDDEADGVQVRVRVARGTALGILFTEPVLEQ